MFHHLTMSWCILYMVIIQMKLRVLLLQEVLPCLVLNLQIRYGYHTLLTCLKWLVSFQVLYWRKILFSSTCFTDPPKIFADKFHPFWHNCPFNLMFQVVNALLTQMDKLKSSPNVIILTTSNITAAIGKPMSGIIRSFDLEYEKLYVVYAVCGIFPALSGSWNNVSLLNPTPLYACLYADIAFVDRADIKAYVGPPTLQARYEILHSCLKELIRTGILSKFQVWFLTQVTISAQF